MSNECKQKFGVEVITGASLDIVCKKCGFRLGLHCGTKCPTTDMLVGEDYEGGNDD